MLKTLAVFTRLMMLPQLKLLPLPASMMQLNFFCHIRPLLYWQLACTHAPHKKITRITETGSHLKRNSAIENT